MPGVQKPHCEPWKSTIACCTGCSVSPCGEILDGQQFGAVDLAEQQDAGVDGFVGEAVTARPAQDHRAGAAIALGAALLRALGAGLLAQPVEQRAIRREAGQRRRTAAEQERNFSARSRGHGQRGEVS